MDSLQLTGLTCSPRGQHAPQSLVVRIGVALRRWGAEWTAAWTRPRALDAQALHALSHLDARTLRDIGAPEVLVSTAEQDEARCSYRRHTGRGWHAGGVEHLGGRDPRW